MIIDFINKLNNNVCVFLLIFVCFFERKIGFWFLGGCLIKEKFGMV